MLYVCSRAGWRQICFVAVRERYRDGGRERKHLGTPASGSVNYQLLLLVWFGLVQFIV